MKRMRQILRQNKFLYWSVLAVTSFAIYTGGQALIGRPDWFYVIGMSLIVPTIMYLFTLIPRDKH